MHGLSGKAVKRGVIPVRKRCQGDKIPSGGRDDHFQAAGMTAFLRGRMPGFLDGRKEGNRQAEEKGQHAKRPAGDPAGRFDFLCGFCRGLSDFPACLREENLLLQLFQNFLAVGADLGQSAGAEGGLQAGLLQKVGERHAAAPL